jgi:hypothetical protein
MLKISVHRTSEREDGLYRPDCGNISGVVRRRSKPGQKERDELNSVATVIRTK